MKTTTLFPQFAIALAAVLLAGCNSRAEVKSPKKPVTNEYHGVKVKDDYQWLENASDPAVKKWSAAQNQQARAVLDKLPTRAFVEDRLQRLFAETSPDYFSLVARRSRIFLLKFQPPAQQPILLALKSADDLKSAAVILDPNQLSANGSTTIHVPSARRDCLTCVAAPTGSPMSCRQSNMATKS